LLSFSSQRRNDCHTWASKCFVLRVGCGIRLEKPVECAVPGVGNVSTRMAMLGKYSCPRTISSVVGVFSIAFRASRSSDKPTLICAEESLPLTRAVSTRISPVNFPSSFLMASWTPRSSFSAVADKLMLVCSMLSSLGSIADCCSLYQYQQHIQETQRLQATCLAATTNISSNILRAERVQPLLHGSKRALLRMLFHFASRLRPFASSGRS